ncbi:MAG: hypothetical protein PSV18_05980 [Methylobacter sp.]|nr:hypothetical protein [Candidatus Methylobacter titanis]
MTPEQQRELWLKRTLPALAVLVIYFVIISGFVTEKSKKAEDQYVGLQQKGINAAALPGIEQQQRTIAEEIAKLEQEDKAIHAAFSENSGFLSQSGSSNDAIEHISIILAKHNLQVLNEQHNDKPVVASLPRSLRDTRIWLKDMIPAEPTTHGGAGVAPTAVTGDDKNLNIWTIRYIGDYPDNYRALSSLNDSNIKALPVSLTMQTYKAEPGKQEWLLTLWL